MTRRHQLLPPILLGLVMLFDSWDAVVLAQTMPALLREWHFGPVIAGTLISVGYAGQFLGAMTVGPFAERFGRMPVLHVTLAVMSVFALLCAVAPQYQLLMVFRFFQGMAIGGALPIGVAYINELAPTPIRGRYFAIFKVLTDAGYTVASVVGILVIPTFGWRWMFALGALPLIVLPFVALLLPESPRWLARRGRVDATNRALTRLGADKVVAGPEDLVEFESVPELQRVSPLTLFAAPYRRQSFIVLPLWLLSSTIVFGVVNWASTIYTSTYHASHAAALSYIAVAGFVFLGLSPIVGLLSDTLGRRRLAIGCSCVSVAAFATLTFVNPSMLPIPAILLQAGSLGMSVMVSMLLWPHTAETFPTEVRATALGFFSAMNRLPPMFVPILIGGVLSMTGSILPVFALFMTCAVGVVIVWVFFARETAGRGLEEINGTMGAKR